MEDIGLLRDGRLTEKAGDAPLPEPVRGRDEQRVRDRDPQHRRGGARRAVPQPGRRVRPDLDDERAGSGGTAGPAAPPPVEQARPTASAAPQSPSRAGGTSDGGDIDVPDPDAPEERRRIGVEHPANASGLANLAGSTGARLAVGRAGPRPRTRTVLLFGADHAVTQDAIFGDVPHELLEQFGLFTVQTRVTSQDEYLLRPDLGRQLDDESRTVVAERCVKKPQVQIVVGDGLSAAAVTNNLPQIYPVIEQGLQSAGLSLGTPFFVRYCRVGVMNDLNDIIQADVVLLLIGERPASASPTR